MNPSDDRKAAAGMHMGMCVFAVLFSIFWCVMAVRVGAGFMVIFGVLFVGLSLWRLALCVKMLRREKGEVGPEKPCASSRDPWDRKQEPAPPARSADGGFCPYCGAETGEGFRYCPNCGRSLEVQ